jgi:hypothetical protein
MPAQDFPGVAGEIAMGASMLRALAGVVCRVARAFSQGRMKAAGLTAKKASDFLCDCGQIEVGIDAGGTALSRDWRNAAFTAIAIAARRSLSLPQRRRGRTSKAQAARGQQARSANDAVLRAAAHVLTRSGVGLPVMAGRKRPPIASAAWRRSPARPSAAKIAPASARRPTISCTQPVGPATINCVPPAAIVWQ